MDAEMIDRLRAMLADLRILAEPATNQPYDCNNESFSLDAAALDAAIAALSATPQAEPFGFLIERGHKNARHYEFSEHSPYVDEMRDIGLLVIPIYATPQAESGYIVDAVAWESFVADYSRYVDGKRDTPFVSIREGLAAVIDSAKPATPQAAQVPVALPPSHVEWSLERARAFVPEGYALVPVEPTDEMIAACKKATPTFWDSDETDWFDNGDAWGCWAAMLAAAQAQGVGRD